MIIGVTKVEYLSEYNLKLNFDNGQIKNVDLKKFLKGDIFEPLKEIEFFKTVKIDEEIETISWANGADFAPDFLYEIGK